MSEERRKTVTVHGSNELQEGDIVLSVLNYKTTVSRKVDKRYPTPTGGYVDVNIDVDGDVHFEFSDGVELWLTKETLHKIALDFPAVRKPA